MSAASELRQGWALVTACAVGFGLGLSGIPFYTYGVFVAPLQASFHWSTALAQGGLTVNYLATIVTIPIVGWLADRFGARRLVLVSQVSFSLSFMMLGTLNGGRLQFFALWFLVSVTGTGTLALTWSRAICGAFDKGRGLALGLAMLGSGMAGFIGPPLARGLLEALGWRMAYVALGTLPLIIALPMSLAFFKETPGRTGEDVRPMIGSTLPDALRNPRLWLIGAAVLMIGLTSDVLG